jgi:phospholipid/cholesterol/gamma-HCH transport system substrate-binding protein
MDTYSSNYKIRLGLFVSAGLVLFIVAIFLIGRQRNLFNPVFKLITSFHNVSGLQVGNTVRFSGINVGTVDNIIIMNDTTIQVEMLLQEDVKRFIKTDCQAAIGSEGIVGDRLIIITQGSAEAKSIRDNQFLTSIEPTETDAILASISVTAENLQVISGQVAEIMFKINNGSGTLSRLIEDSTISENINQMIINLKKGSKGLEENMDAAKSNFLLKGYFKKKERKNEKSKEEETDNQKKENDQKKDKK